MFKSSAGSSVRAPKVSIKTMFGSLFGVVLELADRRPDAAAKLLSDADLERLLSNHRARLH